MVEREFLPGCQRTNGAFRESSQLQRTNRDPHQPQHTNPENVHHPPNLAVFAFVQNNLEPAVLFSRSKQANAACAQHFAIAHSPLQLSNQFLIRHRGNLYVIGFFQIRLGRGCTSTPFGICLLYTSDAADE